MSTRTTVPDMRKRARTHTEDSDTSEMRLQSATTASAIGGSAAAQTPPADREYRSRKKIVACTNCRQSKLRCDTPRDPCSRCERLDLTCAKDISYKRINKKTKVDELEQQVQELKASMSGSAYGPTNHLLRASAVTPHPENPALPFEKGDNRIIEAPSSLPKQQVLPTATHNKPISWTTPTSSLQSLQVPADSVVPPYTPIPDSHRLPPLIVSSGSPMFTPSMSSYSRPPATKVRAIESTALDQQQIDSFFEIYFRNYHTFLPLLDPTKSPDAYFDKSSLLFWTMIAVAVRLYPDDPNLDGVLSKAVTKLAWKVAAEPPLSLGDIQALCIMCTWPATTVHLWSDISMYFSQIFMNAAMHLGLHRPEHLSEFVKTLRKKKGASLTDIDRFERGKTWAVCNIVVEYMTANVGNPPNTSCFNWAIDRSCEVGNAHSLSNNLRHHLMIQRLSHRLTVAMTSNAADPLGLPSADQQGTIMRVFEHELQVLEAEIGEDLIPVTRIYLLCGRFYIYSFHWLRTIMNDDKRAGILRSYHAACTTVSDFLSLDDTYGLLRYSPTVLVRIIFNAGFVIFKILNSLLSQFINYDEGVRLFHMAQVVLRRMSVIENDLAIRGSNVLAGIWESKNDDPTEVTQDPSLTMTSHLTACLTYDASWRWNIHRLKVNETNGVPSKEWVKPGVRENKLDTAVQELNPDPMSFNWELFDDINWGWNLDLT